MFGAESITLSIRHKVQSRSWNHYGTILASRQTKSKNQGSVCLSQRIPTEKLNYSFILKIQSKNHPEKPQQKNRTGAQRFYFASSLLFSSVPQNYGGLERSRKKKQNTLESTFWFVETWQHIIRYDISGFIAK